MMSGNLKQVFLVATTLLAAPAVGAAERVNVDRVIACANEPDDARRLACFDSATAGVKAPVAEAPPARPPEPLPAPAAKPALPQPAAPAAVPATADDFGVSGSAVARQRRSEEEQKRTEAEARSVTAEVTQVTTRPRGELVITLSNEQVWMQKDPQRYFVKPGDRVTINAGTLGSFHMVNGGRSTRVTRVK